MMELLDLGCSFLLESYYHLGLSFWGVTSSTEAQGEVNLPCAASHYYQAFFPALFWVNIIQCIKNETQKLYEEGLGQVF